MRPSQQRSQLAKEETIRSMTTIHFYTGGKYTKSGIQLALYWTLITMMQLMAFGKNSMLLSTSGVPIINPSSLISDRLLPKSPNRSTPFSVSMVGMSHPPREARPLPRASSSLYQHGHYHKTPSSLRQSLITKLIASSKS